MICNIPLYIGTSSTYRHLLQRPQHPAIHYKVLIVYHLVTYITTDPKCQESDALQPVRYNCSHAYFTCILIFSSIVWISLIDVYTIIVVLSPDVYADKSVIM